jgi:3-dehydroquinate synthase
MSEPAPIYTFIAHCTQKCEIVMGDVSGSKALLENKPKYVGVVDEKVLELWHPTVEAVFGNDPCCLDILPVPEGESGKCVDVFLRLMATLQHMPLNRRDALVMIGGGSCCDVGGLAAACFMRGIPHILIPTTLLAMIDATIGGKVAVNLNGGKNLLGGFHNPEAVWIDLEFLKTLPLRQMRQAFAEIVKIAVIAENLDFFSDLEVFSQLGLDPSQNKQLLAEIIKFSIIHKLKLVEPDWREHDLDRLLNAGHSVAHSLETVYGFDHAVLGHGEAVALGLAAKARFSRAKGFISEEDSRRIIELLEGLDLPVSIRLSEQDHARAVEAIQMQQRIRNGNLRLVLPKTACSSFIYHGEDAAEVLNYLGEQ